MADYEFDPPNPLRSDQIAGLLKVTPQTYNQLGVPRLFLPQPGSRLVSLKVEEPFMILDESRGSSWAGCAAATGIFYFHLEICGRRLCTRTNDATSMSLRR